MPQRDHNPSQRRLHLPIVGVTNGPGVNSPGRGKPPWLKVRLASGPNYTELKTVMRDRSLHTVCEEAMCPNIHECWEDREATFLLLGSRCTRRCGFCDVMTAKPDPVDEDEPLRIAEAVRAMGLRYVVLTGVARDDLPDGGAHVWAAAILAIRERPDEVEPAMRDLVAAGCDILTIGQYLQPTTYHLPVDRWVHPNEFAEHKRVGEALGIGHVEAGPLVRSSYHAGTQFRNVR